jgi:hypothetical protein
VITLGLLAGTLGGAGVVAASSAWDGAEPGAGGGAGIGAADSPGAAESGSRGAPGADAADSSGAPATGSRGAPGPDAADGAALAIGAARPLDDGPDVTRWAHIRRPTAARARPGRRHAVVRRVRLRTPEGTVTAVPVHARRTDRGGRLWLRVTLPALPNGTRGWVPRRALGAYEVSRHRLVVDLDRRRVTLLARGRIMFRAPAGVGRPRWPTPPGTFLVRNRLEGYTSRAYGPVAFGLSARSPTLTDWPAGGFVGIHGTDRPELIPGAVSHGCIRLRNADMRRLARLMPVGTRVEIR